MDRRPETPIGRSKTRLSARVITYGLAMVFAAACAAADPVAAVVSVEASGEPGAYQLAVGISSPDIGCDVYADWWEVLSEDGKLLFRRILAHSHADEQPFVRSGGPVAVEAEEVVWVRAHMHPTGYGGRAAKGSVAGGFELRELDPEFAPEVAKEAPLPDGCRF